MSCQLAVKRRLVFVLSCVSRISAVGDVRVCREGAASQLHDKDNPLNCNTGTVFRGNRLSVETAPGCCERPNEAPEAEAQVLSYLLEQTGGNCDVLGTCGLHENIGTHYEGMTKYDASRAPADDDTPPNNVSTGTVVEVSILIKDIDAIDLRKESVGISFHFKQAWNDPRLRWKREDWSHHSKIPNGLASVSHVSSTAIWTPDTYFSRMTAHKEQEAVTIDHNGNVFWVQQMLGQMECDMPFNVFPFDSPICWTDVQSYGYQKQVVSFRVGRLAGTGEPAIENVARDTAGVYFVQEVSFENVLVKDRMGDWRTKRETYADLPGVVMAMTLRHGRWLAIIDYVLKTYVAGLVSCLSLYINPDAVPARAGAAIVTILLTFNTANSVFERIPDLANPTALHWYIFIVVCTTCANFAEYALINYCRTALAKKHRDIQTAHGRSAPDVFYHAICEEQLSTINLHGMQEHTMQNIMRGVRKIRTQEDWQNCIKEFEDVYECNLVQLFNEQMNKTQLAKVVTLLRKRSIEADDLEVAMREKHRSVMEHIEYLEHGRHDAETGVEAAKAAETKEAPNGEPPVRLQWDTTKWGTPDEALGLAVNNAARGDAAREARIEMGEEQVDPAEAKPVEGDVDPEPRSSQSSITANRPNIPKGDHADYTCEAAEEQRKADEQTATHQQTSQGPITPNPVTSISSKLCDLYELHEMRLLYGKIHVTEEVTNTWERAYRIFIICSFQLISAFWLIAVLAMGEETAVTKVCEKLLAPPIAASSQSLACPYE